MEIKHINFSAILFYLFTGLFFCLVTWGFFYNLVEIKFDEEALYFRKIPLSKKYIKIPWHEIKSIKILNNWFIQRMTLIGVETKRSCQILPFILGPRWPSYTEREERKLFFQNLKQKLSVLN